MTEHGGSITVGAGAFLANALSTASNGIEGWVPLLVQSGAIGMLAFVLWHVFAKFIPRLMDAQHDALKEFRSEAAEMRREFKETLKEAIDQLKK